MLLKPCQLLQIGLCLKWKHAQSWFEPLRAGHTEDLGRRTGGDLVASLLLLTHVLGGAAQACRCPPGEGRARRCVLGFCPLPASGLWGYISFFPTELALSPQWEHFPVC